MDREEIEGDIGGKEMFIRDYAVGSFVLLFCIHVCLRVRGRACAHTRVSVVSSFQLSRFLPGFTRPCSFFWFILCCLFWLVGRFVFQDICLKKKRRRKVKEKGRRRMSR